jgi:short subunit dehydrogenase
MDLGLRGKTVLVTGATRRIGRAVALAYAGEGARVGLTYATDSTAAASAVEEIRAAGGDGAALHLELTDFASIAAAIDGAVDRFGSLDVLVANAVRWPEGARGPLAETSGGAWARDACRPRGHRGNGPQCDEASEPFLGWSRGDDLVGSLSCGYGGRDGVCGGEGWPRRTYGRAQVGGGRARRPRQHRQPGIHRNREQPRAVCGLGARVSARA